MFSPYPVCEILFVFLISNESNYDIQRLWAMTLTVKSRSLLYCVSDQDSIPGANPSSPLSYVCVCVCVHALHACIMWSVSSFLPLHFLSLAVFPVSSHLIPLFPPCWNGSSVPDRNENENRYFGFGLACACRGELMFPRAVEEGGG